ncbi:hypothetical protein,Gain [Sulfolobus islandicus L.S.2.15]|uniref:Sulfatase N-terminal domain-containing protein n=1 Tax=Saccharolobus islandicus (strain L.S.2.15 / Lassen \|nr:hypothetical protein,Gain [Sulfolobus islandicus L.S.2.15]
MFTGLYPYFHGVHEYYGITNIVEDFSKLSKMAMSKFDNLISLARDENYETIGISANSFISPSFGFNFDLNYLVAFPPLSIIDNEILASLHKYNSSHKAKLLISLLKDREFSKLKSLILYKLFNNSLREYFYYKSKILHKGCNLILKKLYKIKFTDRFFLFINIMEAHEPYSNEIIGKDPHEKYIYNFLRSIFLGSAENYMIEHYRQHYEVHAMNAINCVLNIISILWKKININNSLIIITSDHGNHIGEKGRVNHGFYLSDELLKVPLYIRYPKDTNRDLKLKSNMNSLVVIYSLIKSIIYSENLDINNNLAISESYGPQHSLRAIKAYFNLTDVDIKKYYTHRIRLSYNGNYLIYDLGKDEIIETSQEFNRAYIQKIKELFS